MKDNLRDNTKIIEAIAKGNNCFQHKRIRSEYLKRGAVARVHTNKKQILAVLNPSTNACILINVEFSIINGKW